MPPCYILLLFVYTVSFFKIRPQPQVNTSNYVTIQFAGIINPTGFNIMFNVGKADQIIRIIVGLFLISLALFGEHIIGQNVVWGWAGIILLVTASFKVCALYSLFGISTYSSK